MAPCMLNIKFILFSSYSVSLLQRTKTLTTYVQPMFSEDRTSNNHYPVLVRSGSQSTHEPEPPSGGGRGRGKRGPSKRGRKKAQAGEGRGGASVQPGPTPNHGNTDLLLA